MIDVKGKRVFLSGPMTGKPSYNAGACTLAGVQTEILIDEMEDA